MNFPSTNPISKDAFANAVIKAIKDAGERQSLRHDAEGIRQAREQRWCVDQARVICHVDVGLVGLQSLDAMDA